MGESRIKKKMIAVVGAGFSGAVIASRLAQAGHQIHVFESRGHIAGNSHTRRDELTGIMLHSYGPHIFHTDNERVWKFVNQFDEFIPYIHRVKAVTQNRVFSLPINLLTINQFFGKVMSPQEARGFIDSTTDHSIVNPKSLEEWSLRYVGRELYEAFFKGYTLKQWGVHPSELPASIIKRLPLFFSYSDNYFSNRYQGIPRNGYSKIIEQLLTNSGIFVQTGKCVDQKIREMFDHIFFSGALDEWYRYKYGSLAYRTLDFEKIIYKGDYQGCAVMNYCDETVPWTRITEHKHFMPWEDHENTICFREFSRNHEKNDIPYYPIRLLSDQAMLKRYIKLGKQEKNVTFIGRLGTYRYLDMDVAIIEAMRVADLFLDCQKHGAQMPAFSTDAMQ